MDVKDLRINDIIRAKAYDDDSLYRVTLIESCGEVAIKKDDEIPLMCDISALHGVKATKQLLSRLGAWYDDKKVEHIFTFQGGLRIAVRPQVGTENYIASRIGEYKPKFCRFTYLHELQHWLWDMYKISIQTY